MKINPNIVTTMILVIGVPLLLVETAYAIFNIMHHNFAALAMELTAIAFLLFSFYVWWRTQRLRRYVDKVWLQPVGVWCACPPPQLMNETRICLECGKPVPARND